MGAEVTLYQHGRCQERRHGDGALAGNVEELKLLPVKS
jgi:hypothetical protein